jgi:hypothetical protein
MLTNKLKVSHLLSRSYSRMERQPHNLPHEDELLYDDGRDTASVAPYGAYSAELTGHALSFQSRTAGEHPKRQFSA